MRELFLVLGFFCVACCLAPPTAYAQMPGDANSDSVVNVGDVVYVVDYLYRDGEPPVFYECGDPTANCIINVGDVVYLINYLFRAGLSPQIVDCGWSEPVNLGEPINSPRGEESFRMTPDGKMAVWASNREGTYGNHDIWYSYWDSVSGSWSEPQNCGPNINSVIEDLFPSLSPDGQKLYCLLFGRPGGFNDWDVWVSTWDSLNNRWGVIENLSKDINTFGAWSPLISPDGSRLYFSHNGIWVSEWNGEGWDDPVSLGSDINATGSESYPTVTADNQTLYFSRYGSTWYICVSHWTGTEWGPAVVLGPQINGFGNARHPYTTSDGKWLYFTSVRAGGLGSTDVWVSERVPDEKGKCPSEERK